MEKLLILIPSLTVSELEELFMESGLSCKKVELNLNETSLIDKGSINKECKKTIYKCMQFYGTAGCICLG